MKKFWIVSITMILVAAIAFGASLIYYIDATNADETPDQVTPTQPQTEATEPVESNLQMPAEWQDNGIFSKYYDKAYTYVSGMTNEQLVGQILLASCPEGDTAKTMVSKYALGGYVYTAGNFVGMDEQGVKSTISSFQGSASTPMIMAVEEEGGAVTAISDLDAFPQYDFSSPRDIFAEGGMDALKDTEQQKATMLSSIGINLNIAPVCDMAEEFTQIMYSRSLGGTVDQTSEYVTNTTTISQDKGVSVALKHFPGYGTIPDTYEPVVVDSREVSVFESTDFKPFEAGVNSGAHCVLVSNVLVEKLDPTCVASLSDYIHTVLRDRIGFTGLMISDNLDNSDYSQYANGKNVYVQAVLAGNHLIMVDNVEDAYTAILAAVNDGTIDKELLQKACTKVIAYKYTVGIMK